MPIQDTPRDIYINNYGFNVVKETLRAMKEHDASYGLPEDFFEGEVIGVPGQ